MSSFGKLVELTYVNDSTTVPISAANKNEEQRVLKITDTELSRSKEYNFGRMKNYYYQRNTKLIEDFQDYTDWAAISSTTLSDDTTNYNFNFNAVKFLENDTTASYIGMTKSISSMDLTEFNDGGASDIDDFIFIVFYISDYTKFANLTIKLGTDNSHNYSVGYTPASSFSRSGYYCLYAKKSDFTDYSGPGWDDITWIYCEAYTASGAQNEYITMQALQLVRKDPDDSDRPNPFQYYRDDLSDFISDIEISNEPWILVWDNAVEELVMYEPEQYDFVDNQFGLLIREDLIEFVFKARVYPKDGDDGILSVSWRVNDENYLECFIQTDTLKIRKREAGSTTTSTTSLLYAVTENRMIDLTIEKIGQTIRYTISQGNETVKRVETSTTIAASSEGDLYFGHYSSNQWSTLADFTLSHNPNSKIDDLALSHVVKNNTVENSVTAASYTTCSDLYVNLPPNQTFEIDCYLVFNCASTAVEAKTKWVSSGVTLIGGVNAMGMAVDSTNAGKADYSKWESYDDLTDEVYFGSETGPCYARITFLIKVGTGGGYVKLQFAQRNTDAGNPLYVRAESYIKTNKIRIVGA